jgi:tetratricopeptide (TPR) repeat protein
MLRTLFLLFLTCVAAAQQTPTPSATDLVKQGEKLNSEGKQDEALALYRQALEMSPNLYEAHLDSGIALDLKGSYPEAREHLNKAIELAPPESKQQALRTMAISYAFEKNGGEAAEFEQQVFDTRVSAHDFTGAAETANELARIYLESGDTTNAYKWYQSGYETAQKKPGLSDEEKNLWLFRWESAQARVSARTGNANDAVAHVAAARLALDKAKNPDQERFFPYLTGYVAFYGGEYKTAINSLEKADQRDPMNLALLAESYEKSGDESKAMDYYRKVLAINSHNPTNAFARPLARQKLQM